MQREIYGTSGKPSVDLMKYIVLFQIISVILYFIGPIEWKTRNTILTFFLVTLYVFSLWIGNKYGEKRYKPIANTSIRAKGFFLKHYSLLALISIAIKIVSIERTVRLFGWNSAIDIVGKLFSGDMSDLYYAEKLVNHGSQMFGGSLFSIGSLVLSPIAVMIVPLTIIYFSELKIHQKVLGIVSLTSWFLASIGQGTTEGFYIIIVYLMTGFVIKKTRRINHHSFGKKEQIKKTIMVIGVAFLILAAFNFIMTDRMNNKLSFGQLGENYIDVRDNWLYDIMPAGIENLIVYMDVYLCQGYYGMSLATTLNWVPLLGMGSSRWLISEMDAIFPGIYNLMYSVRVEKAGYAWGDRANWHSAYTWFANDFSFFGVIFVMFFLGWLFAQVYKDAYHTQNPVAVGMLALLIQMLLFLPCNNIVFANSHTMFPFFFYLVVWLCMKYKIKFKVK